MENKKYRITENKSVGMYNNKTYDLYQIEALIDIPEADVKKGDLGGYIQGEFNLSNNPDDISWVDIYSKVYGNSVITNSLVYSSNVADSNIISSSLANADIYGSTIFESFVDRSNVQHTCVMNAKLQQSAVYISGQIQYATIMNSTISESPIFGDFEFMTAILGSKLRKALIMSSAIINSNIICPMMTTYNRVHFENSEQANDGVESGDYYIEKYTKERVAERIRRTQK